MAKKVIVVNLSEEGIDKAISELNAYKLSIQKKTELLRMRIAEYVRKEAQSGFNGALVDDVIRGGGGKIADVKVTVSNRGSITAVIANGEDAIWVEFGAGVYHNGAVGSSPNPVGPELGFTIGGYGEGNGGKKTWGYYEDGELHLTRGTPAKMPMALAMNDVVNNIARIVREVFG